MNTNNITENTYKIIPVSNSFPKIFVVEPINRKITNINPTAPIAETILLLNWVLILGMTFSKIITLPIAITVNPNIIEKTTAISLPKKKPVKLSLILETVLVGFGAILLNDTDFEDIF
tara:strand:+ start:34 stop:387 length:354 start_codon:yes stop_codon:yes gene_type:complete